MIIQWVLFILETVWPCRIVYRYLNICEYKIWFLVNIYYNFVNYLQKVN